MSEQISCQKQSIPAYSGITINITNPMLNAAPLQATYENGKPAPYYPQQQAGTNYLVSPNGYYAQAEIANQSNDNKANTEVHNNNKSSDSAVNTITERESSKETIIYNPENTPDAQAAENAQAVPDGQKQPGDTLYDAQNQAYPIQESAMNNPYAAQNSTAEKNGPRNEQNSELQKNDTKQDIKEASVPSEQVSKNSEEEDMSISQNIIAELDARDAEQKELEKNGQQKKITALTNEYIMSLENYLNNPNTDIRLMAAKEVLTRLNEDRDRYDDAALNALLNKMLQDPAKLVRIAAMSALSSDLASGNDYTVEILNRIQQDPNSDKEDVLESAQILLNMSATTEVKYTPVTNQIPLQPKEVEEQ